MKKGRKCIVALYQMKVVTFPAVAEALHSKVRLVPVSRETRVGFPGGSE